MEQKENIVARGAEAVILKQKNKIIKDRIPKSYRIQQLDEKLRKLRTRSEAKLLEKANKIIPTPKLIKTDEQKKIIEIEFLNGKKLSDNLEKLNYSPICIQIGKNLAKLHDTGIIHGDLTTSNMIYVEKNKKENVLPHHNLKENNKHQSDDFTYNNIKSKHERAGGVHAKIIGSSSQQPTISKQGKVYFIDFGLGFHSNKIEDKAVDLHLIKEALEAKHHSIFEQAFSSVLKGYKSSKNSSQVLKQLEKVEKRGRYKAQY